MKPLIWKEIRENVRWLPVGLIGLSLVAWMAMPNQHDKLLAYELVRLSAILLPLLAFGLGLVQSIRDLQPAAGAYLHHRSVSRRQVFLAKTLAGFLIYALSIALPLLVLAAWIGIQGMDAYPMRPAQLIPTLAFALAAFAMHPLAMLVMVRSAPRWTTRWFPLLPAAIALFPLPGFLGSGGFVAVAYILPVALLALAYLIAIACEGWRDLAGDPPASRLNDPLRRRGLLPSYLTLTALLVATGVVAAAAVVAESLPRTPPRPASYNRLAIHAPSGQPWLLTYRIFVNEAGHHTTFRAGGDRIASGKVINPLEPLEHADEFDALTTLWELHRPISAPSGDYAYSDGFFSLSYSRSGRAEHLVFDQRGYLLAYSGFPRRWSRTIAADGLYPAGQLQGKPFTGHPLFAAAQVFGSLAHAGYQMPWIDSQGVYLLKEEPAAMDKLIDQRIDAASLFQRREAAAPRLLVLSGPTLSEYRLVDASGSERWFEEPADDARPVAGSKPLPAGLSAERIQAVDLPPALSGMSRLQIAATREGFVVAEPSETRRLFQISSDGAFQEVVYSVAPGTASPSVDDRVEAPLLVAALVPPLAMVSAIGSVAWMAGEDVSLAKFGEGVAARPVQTTVFVIVFFIGQLASLVLVLLAARARALRRGQVLGWSLAIPLLGLAAPLSILTIHRAVHRERCLQCEKPRRVDQSRCEHCGAEWEPPQREGIEITDRRLAASEQAAMPV